MVRHRPVIGATDRARYLRNHPTRAERAMWRLLRAGFPDVRFRRQVPIGIHVADFASHRSKLVIEVDGGQHGSERDDERSRLIGAAGYRVIRFWNNDVSGNPEGVARPIDAALGTEATPTPTPTLPPRGGGGFQEHPPWRV